MNKSNRYFLATAISGLVVTLGFAGIAMRGFYPAYEAFLRFCGVTVETCQRLIEGLSPVNVLAAASVVWLLTVFVWQMLRTRLVLNSILSQVKPTPNYLESLSMRLGLANRIKLVSGNVLFCSGYLSPQVVVGRGVLNTLSQRELEAALLHESYHIRNLDPLKVLLATTFSRAFFFVPAIKELAKLYLHQKEILADEYAEGRVGKVFLSKALYKVLAKANPEDSDLPAYAGFADVRTLENSPASSWIISATLILGVFILTSLLSPADAVGVTGGC